MHDTTPRILLEDRCHTFKDLSRLITCDAWKRMKSISAEEGLVAIPYSGEFAQYGRLYQVAKLYIRTVH